MRNDRNPNAVFEERGPTWTDWCEEHERKAARKRAKELCKIRRTDQVNKDTLFGPRTDQEQPLGQVLMPKREREREYYGLRPFNAHGGQGGPHA